MRKVKSGWIAVKAATRAGLVRPMCVPSIRTGEEAANSGGMNSMRGGVLFLRHDSKKERMVVAMAPAVAAAEGVEVGRSTSVPIEGLS